MGVLSEATGACVAPVGGVSDFTAVAFANAGVSLQGVTLDGLTSFCHWGSSLAC